MANLADKITAIVMGNSAEITRTIETVPEGDSIDHAYLYVKEEFWDLDADAIIRKHITTSLSADGHVEDTGSGDTEGVITFYLLPVDTLLLHEFFEYVFDIKIFLASGQVYTPDGGTIISSPRVTRAEE